MAAATDSPLHRTQGSTTQTPNPSTSAKKAESNRRNAQKSTGPRTEQGKANSRVNALKHGVLASSGVITTIEGREHRAEFEAIVDGLAADFQPVGGFEQMLVQDIAACFWRKRRLLRFESRAAFEARDRRTHAAMVRFCGDERIPQPHYTLDGHKAEADEVLHSAHLGPDLPDEADCKCLIRYEASITRTLKLALAEFRRSKAERLAHPSAASEDREVVVDADAMKVNAGEGHRAMDVKSSLLSRALDRERAREEEEAEEAEDPQRENKEALARVLTEKIERGLGYEIYQTKPNSPANPATSSAREPQPQDAEASAAEHQGAIKAPPKAAK